MAILPIMSDTWRVRGWCAVGKHSTWDKQALRAMQSTEAWQARSLQQPCAVTATAHELKKIPVPRAPRWARSSARTAGCACRAEPSGSCPCHCCACDPWCSAFCASTPSSNLRWARSVEAGSQADKQTAERPGCIKVPSKRCRPLRASRGVSQQLQCLPVLVQKDGGRRRTALWEWSAARRSSAQSRRNGAWPAH